MAMIINEKELEVYHHNERNLRSNVINSHSKTRKIFIRAIPTLKESAATMCNYPVPRENWLEIDSSDGRCE